MAFNYLLDAFQIYFESIGAGLDGFRFQQWPINSSLSVQSL